MTTACDIISQAAEADMNGDSDDAIDMIFEVLWRPDLQPSDRRMALNTLGCAYSAIGEFDLAILCHTQQIALFKDGDEPGSTSRFVAYLNRGRRYEAVGQFERAFADLAMALAILPQGARFMSARGSTVH